MEGADAPTESVIDVQALAVWRRLGNGMGGMDWSGLDLQIEDLGITDVEGLLVRLDVLRGYQKPQ